MKKLLQRLTGRKSQQNLLNAILLASRKFPNDMELGRCIRNFMFITSTAGTMSEKDMYKIMEESIEYTKLKNPRP
jgi:hypothetical protein